MPAASAEASSAASSFFFIFISVRTFLKFKIA